VHIAFVTHAFPRWKGDIAGSFIERLARAVVDRGHRVTVITPAHEGRGGPERRASVDILWVRYGPAEQETLAHTGTMVEATSTLRGKSLALSLIAALARPLRRLHRSGELDVVHAHWWVPGGVAAWMAHKRRRCPYVITVHGTDVRLLDQSRLLRAVARRVIGRASAVTAVSSFLAREVARLTDVVSDAITVQPMPADLVRLVRRSTGGGGVVTVGRLVPQKRIDMVLEAVARLHRGGRPTPLTVIGDGPLRGALQDHANRLGIAAMTEFVGQVEPERLSQAIGNADVFAFAARGEGLGLAAAEAFILGVPVAAADDGSGVRDVVPPSGAGRLVPENDPEALAAAMVQLMDDPEARQLAATTGEALRAQFDPANVAGRFEALYSRVAKRQR
jgi:glycosyltransferase involved in cell wall biosynthesis